MRDLDTPPRMAYHVTCRDELEGLSPLTLTLPSSMACSSAMQAARRYVARYLPNCIAERATHQWATPGTRYYATDDRDPGRVRILTVTLKEQA